MGKESETHHWLKEARERYWGTKSNLNNVKRWKKDDGSLESIEHFRGRKDRLRERVEHREDIVKHLANKLEALQERKDEKPVSGNGYAAYDGKTVPAWVVPWLEKSRKAGWSGVVVSGVRTATYSIQLCRNMCGADSCPGTCGGASSNHNMEPGEGYPEGALDVSDYTRFEAIQFQIDSPLRNELPNDPVHFSVSGH